MWEDVKGQEIFLSVLGLNSQPWGCQSKSIVMLFGKLK